MPVIVTFALGWLAGIWLSAQLNPPPWVWLSLAGPALLGLVLARSRRAWRVPLILVMALGLGGARRQSVQPVFTDATLASYNDRGEVTLEGVVWDEPEPRDTRVHLRVQAQRLWLAEAAEPLEVSGLVLVRAPRLSESRLTSTGAAEFRYGDRVRITGWLETPPEFEDFSYRDYLARLGVYSQVREARMVFLAERQGSALWQALFDIKARALTVLAQIFPEPHAALLQGILLGVEANIPADIKTQFSLTGTSHVIAISGFNVSILVALFMALAGRWLGERRGALVALAAVAVYTVLVGASASVVRAAFMGGLSVVAARLGRRSPGLNALSAAAIAMTALNPLTLWDVGFQLSAAATLGLILYADPFQAAAQRGLARFLPAPQATRLAHFCSDAFLLTLAAQITTLPLIAFYFKQLSLISLLANLVILPAQPAVMILGGLALLLGLIWLPLGQLAAWAAWPFAAYTLAFVDWFARAPGAALPLGDVAPALLVAFYAALFGLTWVLVRPPDQRPAEWKRFSRDGLAAAGVLTLATATFLAWSWRFSLPEAPGRLRMTILDVGQGDAVLIQSPTGAAVLIDGGPSGGALVRGLAQQLPLFAAQLDLLVIAAPDDENIGGLPDALTRFSVRRALLTQAASRGAAYRTVRETLYDRGVEIVEAADQPSFDLGAGVWLRVLADDEQGSTLRVEWKHFALVLPVTLDAQRESELIQRGLAEPATALLLSAHGSAKATSEEWVQTVNPQVVVVSLAAGHDPDDEVLDRLAGRTLLRTDQHGAVTLITDGEQLWVETEK
jgi:competence protein ComEC